MKKNLIQTLLVAIVVATVVASPVAAQRTVKMKPLPSASTVTYDMPAPTPVSQPVVYTQPVTTYVPTTVPTPAPVIYTVPTSTVIPDESTVTIDQLLSFLVASGDLTQEQADQILKAYNSKPGYVNWQDVQAAYKELQDKAASYGYQLPDLNAQTILAALQKLQENADLQALIATLKDLQNQVETTLNEKKQDPATLKQVQKTLQLMDQMVIKNVKTMRVYVVPASQMTDNLKNLSAEQLYKIEHAYALSVNRLEAIDTTQPTAYDALYAEFVTMWYNSTSHTAYFETIARPVIGSVDVLVAEPAIRYIAGGLKMYTSALLKALDSLNAAGMYSDTAKAQLMGANYLMITGDTGNTSKVEDQLNKAVYSATQIISAGQLIGGVDNYPGKFVGFSVNDMKVALNLLHLTVQVGITKN